MSSKDCVFCEIIAGNAPATIIREWDDALAFVPLNPVTPGHLLVIPKKHVQTIFSSPDVAAATMRRVSEMVHGVERHHDPNDYNVITSAGEAATQTVWHFHVHLVPRRPNDGLALPWTPQPKPEPCRHGTTVRGRIEHALFYAMRDEFEDECIDEYAAAYAGAVIDELGLGPQRDIIPNIPYTEGKEPR